MRRILQYSHNTVLPRDSIFLCVDTAYVYLAAKPSSRGADEVKERERGGVSGSRLKREKEREKDRVGGEREANV